MFKLSKSLKIGIISVVCCSICFLLSNNAFAECVGTETVLINCDVGGDGGIFFIVRIVMEVLLAGIGVLSTIAVIAAGFQYMTARDNADQVAAAKKRIINMIVGVAAAGLVFVIIEFLLPGGVFRDVNVESVTISFDGSVEVGEYAVAHITISPPDANDLTYSLSTVDKNIVRVTNSNVKCMNIGTAVVTVITANGKTASASVTCKKKTEFAKPAVPRRGDDDDNPVGSGDYYPADRMLEANSGMGNVPDQDYEKLKKYAYDKFGIHEDNFIGIVAWARIENYEQNDTGDGKRIYMSYLCNSVGINNALAYEKQGNPSGWLDEMVNGGSVGWGSDYSDSRYYGSSGYYQSNLKSVRFALDHLYPGITNCSGNPLPSGKTMVFQGTNLAGQAIYIW